MTYCYPVVLGAVACWIFTVIAIPAHCALVKKYGITRGRELVRPV